MSTQLNSLLAISQLLATKPTLDELCIFLSLRHCPSGEVSRVYFAKIINNEKLRIEAAHGFEPENCFAGKLFPIEVGRPSGRSILENKMVIESNTSEFYERYPALDSAPTAFPWISQISIPISSNYFMQCGRYVPMGDGDELFYQNLQSLMQIYFTRIGRVSQEVGDLFGKQLTARQEKILEMMRDGLTNEDIAKRIRYSPSLVKQESMLIFSKLGISGRRELTQTP